MGPVLGRYELLTQIGTGGMATVWAARQRGTRGFQKIVALKTMLPSLSADPKYQRLLFEEAKLTARIRHPNVAQILDLGEDNGVLFLAMEWIDGVSVSELLRAAQSSGAEIPLSVAIRIATQVAAGLHAAHELRDADGELIGLVHRDVSPQNILVSVDGIAKVVDFGLAKVTCDGQADALQSFQVRGKVGYLSPEQITDSTADRRVDIFALGIVLYVMTTGAHPFEGRGPLATLYNISCDEPVTPPSTFRRDYPEELEAAVLRCLEKDKTRRFATCDELVWSLESSISSDLRATDQDVAVFVRSLAGHIGAERQHALELAAPDYASVSRWPSISHCDLDEQVVPLDTDGCTSPAMKPLSWLPDGPGPVDSAPPSILVSQPQPSRREGSLSNLLLWAAVFAVSLWMLVSQVGVASSSAEATSAAKPAAGSPCAYAAPTSSIAPEVQQNPERGLRAAGTKQTMRPALRRASDGSLLR